MKLKTKTLQEMLAKSYKGVSNNKLIPITSLLNIKVQNNLLLLTTTDATNYLYIKAPEKVDCENIEFSVLADTFFKLITKITTENVELNIDGNILNIKANGNYKIELPLDENGDLIKFPTKSVPDTFGSIVKHSVVDKILNYNKASLAVSVELPSLACYYCGDYVVTSDRFKICKTDIKMFDKPLLISSSLMDLLSIMTDEEIQYSVTPDNEMVFVTNNELIISPVVEDIEQFPIDAIVGLATSEFTSSCKLSRSAILDVLERIALFVSDYDKKAIYLTFTKDGLMISSKKSSGVEVIPYEESENFKDYTCCIDFEMLKSQITTQGCETINLAYGSEVAVKLTDGNVTQIVALAEDDRVSE